MYIYVQHKCRHKVIIYICRCTKTDIAIYVKSQFFDARIFSYGSKNKIFLVPLEHNERMLLFFFRDIFLEVLAGMFFCKNVMTQLFCKRTNAISATCVGPHMQLELHCQQLFCQHCQKPVSTVSNYPALLTIFPFLLFVIIITHTHTHTHIHTHTHGLERLKRKYMHEFG